MSSNPRAILSWKALPISELVTFKVGLSRPGYDRGTCKTHCSLSISKGKSGSEGAIPKVSVVPTSSVLSVGRKRRLSWFIWNSRGFELSAFEIGLWAAVELVLVMLPAASEGSFIQS
ncbi:hypothetical protein AFLA_001487 [Aspergillus flavus NRRL3357]|nr:hypothetical protein AFLA_001487 [Aspergillus flavus NRRL3357]